MISKVAIRNFKSLRAVEADLERFTVFVGPNASGKSSILQAIDLLCHAFHGPGERYLLGGVAMQGMGAAPAQDVEAELSQGRSRGSADRVELKAQTDGCWSRYRTRSSPLLHGPGDGQESAATLESGTWKLWNPAENRTPPVPLSVLLRLETSKLIQPTPAPMRNSTDMAPDGAGLHSALANMALNDPDSWQALQGDLRQIIPTVRRLRHTKATLTQSATLLFDTMGADSLPAHQVSEGTLLVLGLLAALYAADRPNLVLLDDLDRGLHPKAQRELIMLLRGLLSTNPDLQIAATTHSPYLLDCMDVDEVRLTFLGDDGATVCAALTSHPAFPKWKEEMTPGEMWSLFGEKWVAEEVTS